MDGLNRSKKAQCMKDVSASYSSLAPLLIILDCSVQSEMGWGGNNHIYTVFHPSLGCFLRLCSLSTVGTCLLSKTDKTFQYIWPYSKTGSFCSKMAPYWVNRQLFHDRGTIMLANRIWHIHYILCTSTLLLILGVNIVQGINILQGLLPWNMDNLNVIFWQVA